MDDDLKVASGHLSLAQANLEADEDGNADVLRKLRRLDVRDAQATMDKLLGNIADLRNAPDPPRGAAKAIGYLEAALQVLKDRRGSEGWGGR
jgi:hypothetical protein